MSETFTDADTILASPDFDIGALIEAETLTVRVCPYQDLIEVDTFRAGRPSGCAQRGGLQRAGIGAPLPEKGSRPLTAANS